MKIIVFFLFALLVLAYLGNTRPSAEIAAAAWTVGHANCDPAISCQ